MTSRGPFQPKTFYDSMINDLDNGAECTLGKLASDTKLRDVADRPDGCAVIQRDPDRLRSGLTGIL